MFRLTCQEVLHDVFHGDCNRRNLFGHAIERQRSARLDFNPVAHGYDLVDRFSY